MSETDRIKSLVADIGQIELFTIYGKVRSIRGLMIEIAGPLSEMPIGGRLDIEGPNNRIIPAEIIGLDGDKAIAMPFESTEGLHQGARAFVRRRPMGVYPHQSWLGRVLNGLGQPMDGKGPLMNGPRFMPFRAEPPPAHSRQRVGAPLDLHVRVLDTFLTTCRGQRMGIFAGSGVGKSVLLSMLARNASSDVAVIGLVGERGREVQEFLQDDLGDAGLNRSIVVIATSDESALMRRQAAYLTLAISEYFRDDDHDVLCMMDSVTRFAMAQREIGLASGEPPTTKGYTPTVFTELPRLLERAGPGLGKGSITGIFTVLVDGDDHNEPVADAVRGILDGHIVMERAIAERGRYPAVNVLKSVSRTMPKAADPEFWPVVKRARSILATFNDMEELIRLGAYRAGSSPDVDEAIRLYPFINEFLSQSKEESTSLSDSYRRLAEILAG